MMSSPSSRCCNCACQRTKAEPPFIAFRLYCTLTAAKNRQRRSTNQCRREKETVRSREGSIGMEWRVLAPGEDWSGRCGTKILSCRFGNVTTGGRGDKGKNLAWRT